MNGPTPSETGKNFDRLKALLREMFQLDRGDLDFGLYRIMNMKAGEIGAFLDRDLLPQVKTVLAGVADEERARTEAALADRRTGRTASRPRATRACRNSSNTSASNPTRTRWTGWC